MTDTPELYRAMGTVLENANHGPQLCGVVAMSYPPLGAGIDISGWDWDAVEHKSAQGVLWGEFVLTGTYDGDVFTLTQPPETSTREARQRYPELQTVHPGEPARVGNG